MFLWRDVQNSSFLAPTGRPQAMVLILSLVTVWICEGRFPHWKTPRAQPQDELTFSKRKLCHMHHCIKKCIEMRVTPRFICLESGSPNYTQQISSLHFPLSWLRSRFLHPGESTNLPFFFLTKTLMCAQHHIVWWKGLPFSPVLSLHGERAQWLRSANWSSFFLERFQSRLNNKWLQSSFLIEMRININAIMHWWLRCSVDMDQHLNTVI